MRLFIFRVLFERFHLRFSRTALILFLLFSGVLSAGAQSSFTVGTYNLERFNPEKNEAFEEKYQKIIESIAAMNADVVGLVEVGKIDSVKLLLDGLEKAKTPYRYYEWMASNDGNLHLAVFSRYPLKETRYHKSDTYSLGGKRYNLKRGILETSVQITKDYSFTVLLTHLKSQVATRYAPQEEIRLEEAKLVRKKLDEILKKNMEADFILMGDLNDNFYSRPVRTLIGNQKGQSRLMDTRPIEPIGDTLPSGRTRGKYRSVAWTHFYSSEDSYSRLDYILCSPGMRDQFLPEQTAVIVVPNWGHGSDHRPIKAGFRVP